jgi:uncharacterized protein (DUF433 family)
MTVATSYEHIVLDEKNVPYIAGTRFKVIQLVLNHQAYGWSPEELKFQHPQLTMGQIHSALAYYWDHKEDLDDYIEKSEIIADEILKEIGTPFHQMPLKSKGMV